MTHFLNLSLMSKGLLFPGGGEPSKGLTQVELAARLGISQGTLSTWVSGKSKPKNPALAAQFEEYELREVGKGKMRFFKKEDTGS